MIQITLEQLADLLRETAQEGINAASPGDYTDAGIAYHVLNKHGFLTQSESVSEITPAPPARSTGDSPYAYALKVKCPHCYAAPGDPCIIGGSVSRSIPHTERYTAALEAFNG